MAQDDNQERTEEATPKRQNEAREKGQIARSRELNTLLMLLASTAALLSLGGRIIGALSHSIESGFQVTRKQIFDPIYTIVSFKQAVYENLIALAPFLTVTVVVALIAPTLLGGWSFSIKALSFKWEKLNPLKGMKRVFGWQGLMELVKALAKFLIVVVFASVTMWMLYDQFLGLGAEPVKQGLAHAAQLVLWTLLITSSGLIIVAAVDVPFQIWNHNKQMRMTKQEVKDEFKDTEGKPEVKRRVREVQMEISRRRMMAEVPKADVIITNPTHYAVALKYEGGSMAAPILLAKGGDLIAQEIRRVGRESKVPIMESPALARSIYWTTELNAEIPEGLYKAVAMVLAYVMQTKQRRRRYSERPLKMTNVPIPDELKRDK